MLTELVNILVRKGWTKRQQVLKQQRAAKQLEMEIMEEKKAVKEVRVVLTPESQSRCSGTKEEKGRKRKEGRNRSKGKNCIEF
jgi:hypothetical protein